MQTRYRDYDIPDFVKESPNYSSLFKVEDEIVKNEDGKWGIKRAVDFSESPEIDKKPTSKVEFRYDTFFEAYYDNERRDRTLWFSDEIAREIFVNQVDDEDEQADDDLIILTRKTADEFYRMYFRNHGDYRLRSLESSYQQWKEQDAEINQDSFVQENIVDVYYWLTSHPNFWKQRECPDGSFDWETDYRLGDIVNVFPQRDSDTQDTYWTAEGGYHVLDNTDKIPYATTYYHDYALNSTGDTYEEALLGFAKNVWLQTRGLLKEREAERDAWLDSLRYRGENSEEVDNEE